MSQQNQLLSPAEMALADRAAVALGHTVAALMTEAGRAVARAVMREFAPCRTVVLCGPGNNGGDGYAAARFLDAAGWPVAVAALAPPQGDAAQAARGWRGPTVPFAAAEVARSGLVIDAVFGAGLSRALPEEVEAVLDAAPRIAAVDVPSGLDGATGAPLGRVAAASLTVTFFRLKPGHLLLPGRTLCGRTVLADIGLPARALEGIAVRSFRNTPALWSIPAPGPEDHKYSRGHLTVLGGAAMAGAARLAAAAARRAGAGLVTIAAQANADLYRTGDAGVIVDAAPIESQLRDTRRNAFVCGPGLGAAAAASALPVLLASGRAVVVDADALTCCAGAPDRLRGASVLTPHDGEFARVFGPVGPDRLEACRKAAALTGCVVLLKGGATVVAAPDGRAAINDTAPADLATAGAGDVLAGTIGGLLAQGMPPWEAACAAAWIHGRAGALAGPGLLAEDLPPLLPQAVAETRFWMTRDRTEESRP
jgi:ADP-dependent NAD(P)H-hydrate dehydratase / NAD(P)H-hydrate epimerase